MESWPEPSGVSGFLCRNGIFGLSFSLSFSSNPALKATRRMRLSARANRDQNVPLHSLQDLSDLDGAACEEFSSVQHEDPCRLRLDGELFHVFIS